MLVRFTLTLQRAVLTTIWSFSVSHNTGYHAPRRRLSTPEGRARAHPSVCAIPLSWLITAERCSLLWFEAVSWIPRSGVTYDVPSDDVPSDDVPSYDLQPCDLQSHTNVVASRHVVQHNGELVRFQRLFGVRRAVQVLHDPVPIHNNDPGSLYNEREFAEAIQLVHNPLHIGEHVHEWCECVCRLSGRFASRSAYHEGAEAALMKIVNESPQLGDVIEALESRVFPDKIQNHRMRLQDC